MYKLIYKLEDIRQLVFFYNSIFYKSKEERYRLIEIDKNDFSRKWISNCLEVSDYAVSNEFLVFDSDDTQMTYLLLLNDKRMLGEFRFSFAFDRELFNNKYLIGNRRNSGICVLNIALSQYNIYPNPGYSVQLLIDEDLLCLNPEKNIISFRKIDLTLQWYYDIHQLGNYQEKKFINQPPVERCREVNRVYYYHNKIIVTISRAIIALNPDNGELLWKIDFENYDPVTLLFEGNIAYSGRLIYFATIDVDNGVKQYERDFDPVYRFEVEGFQLSHIRYIGLAFYKDHLWFTHEDKGHQFLLKAIPSTGEIVDGLLLESKSSSDAPVFDDNRMYINDQDGELFIYEDDQ